MRALEGLESQQAENETVRDELSRVDPAADPGARVYKLVGPALVPTDLDEARANVTKRLDFIKKEMCAN